jgi:hypothetical protein
MPSLQSLCELGQEQLMRMEYLAAERTLLEAEQIARRDGDFDTLGRLYMPLQETRRQRRQRCGEGVVCLDLIARGPDDHLSAEHVIANYPHGQLLAAGWGSIAPAVQLRELQKTHDLYVETFLAAAYPIGDARAVAIVPTDAVQMPDPSPRQIDELIRLLPPHAIVLHESELPRGSQKGSWQTFSHVMEMWEKLHAPFLAQADQTAEPMQKMEAYRRTIAVDYACELAHQRLADVARGIAKKR